MMNSKNNQDYHQQNKLDKPPVTLNESEYDALKREVRKLQAAYSDLVLERDYLKEVELKKIEARYLCVFGDFEQELIREKTEYQRLKRELEMIRASLNRQEKINPGEIKKNLDEEYQEYFDKIREMAEKTAKARAKQKAAGYENDSDHRSEKVNVGTTAGDGQGADGGASDGNDNGAASESCGRVGSSRSADGCSTENGGAGSNDSGSASSGEPREQRMRRLYREIVKKLHPDINPHQTEREKKLFQRAADAWQNGDLKTLEEIAEILKGEEEVAEDPLRTMEKLKEEKERLQALIRAIQDEMERIRNSYPYTMKEILESQEKTKNRKEEFRTVIEMYRRQSAVLKEQIEKLQGGHEQEKA